MNKLAVIYNICGISKKESFDYYVKVLNSIYAQRFDDKIVAVSACCVQEVVLNELKATFPSLFIVSSYEVVPVQVSFNLTVQKLVDRFGPYEGYLYIDYGVNFCEDNKVLNKLYERFKSGKYGMVSTQTDNDCGYHLWFGLGKFHGDDSENYRLFENGDFIVPVGKCVNLHTQLFSHKLYEAYNKRIIPDIFAAYCTESVLSFLNAAIGLQWLITKDIILHHAQIPQNSASGFGGGIGGLDKMYKIQTDVLDLIKPGIPYGMGYDESRKLVMHDESQFDENGFCKNDKLATYINDYMFLPKDILNYDELPYCEL